MIWYFKQEQFNILWCDCLQISGDGREGNIHPGEVDIYVEFIMDGVLPQYGEENIFPLVVKTDPVIYYSEENIVFNSNWPCADEHIHMKVIISA